MFQWCMPVCISQVKHPVSLAQQDTENQANRTAYEETKIVVERLILSMVRRMSSMYTIKKFATVPQGKCLRCYGGLFQWIGFYTVFQILVDDKSSRCLWLNLRFFFVLWLTHILGLFLATARISKALMGLWPIVIEIRWLLTIVVCNWGLWWS